MNRLIKTSTTERNETDEYKIYIEKTDTTEVFHIENKEITYEDGRIYSVHEKGSETIDRYNYRSNGLLDHIYNRNTFKSPWGRSEVYFGNESTHFDLNMSVSYHGYSHHTRTDWISTRWIDYDYNDHKQISYKERGSLKLEDLARDSTTFDYIYNEDQLIQQINKNFNTSKPFVSFEYNEHLDLIKVKDPSGVTTYEYTDYDDQNNWLIRSKYLNGEFVAREEREIEYY